MSCSLHSSLGNPLEPLLPMTSPIWHSSFAYCLAHCTPISCSLHSSFNNTLGQGFRSPNVSYSCQLLITTVLASYICLFGMHLLPILLRVPHLYLAFARFVQQPTRFRLQFTQHSLHLSAARHKRLLRTQLLSVASFILHLYLAFCTAHLAIHLVRASIHLRSYISASPPFYLPVYQSPSPSITAHLIV